MSDLKYIAVHHFGGTSDPYAKTQLFTEKQINASHQANWPNFKSSMLLPSGGSNYMGYNIVIYPDRWVQYRPLGAETAANRGFNSSAISICFAGNFTLRAGTPVEKPLDSQKKFYEEIAMALLMRDFSKFVVVPGTTFSLSVNNIYPHRFFNQTTCYGDSLDSNWARSIINDVMQIKIAWIRSMIAFYQAQLDKLRRKEFGRMILQGNDQECPGHL